MSQAIRDFKETDLLSNSQDILYTFEIRDLIDLGPALDGWHLARHPQLTNIMLISPNQAVVMTDQLGRVFPDIGRALQYIRSQRGPRATRPLQPILEVVR